MSQNHILGQSVGGGLHYLFQDYYIDSQGTLIKILRCLRSMLAINKVGKINMWMRGNILYSNSKHRLLKLIGRMCHNHILKWYSSEISPYSKIGRYVIFPHPIGIVIGNGAVIGNHVTIYHNTTIGKTKNDEYGGYPSIGDNVVVYTGVTIIGEIDVANDCIIGAHSVLTQSTEEGCTYVGAPAKKIK